MRISFRTRVASIGAPPLLAVALAVAGASCAETSSAADELPAVLQHLAADRPAPALDEVEVWVCDVPADTTAPIYGDLPLRLEITPESVIEQVAGGVADYFATISLAQYRQHWRPGGTVTMSPTDDDADCVDAVLAGSSSSADVVLAVATAEHVEGQPGGWGQPGSWLRCDGRCPAALTRRAAYIGASDFSPGWGPVAPRDLIEHELGHTLGLPHSGAAGAEPTEYTSALDVMSNSAAPRDTDPDARDAPDTIAVDRFDLGWLPLDDVVVVAAAADVDLHPSTGSSGDRLAVVELSDHRMITIELLTATGFDQHLPESGVVVHVVSDADGANIGRSQETVGSDPPHTELLTAGEQLELQGWRVVVRAIDDTARVAIAPADG